MRVLERGERSGNSVMKCAFRLRYPPPLIIQSRMASSDGEIFGWSLESDIYKQKAVMCTCQHNNNIIIKPILK